MRHIYSAFSDEELYYEIVDESCFTRQVDESLPVVRRYIEAQTEYRAALRELKEYLGDVKM